MPPARAAGSGTACATCWIPAGGPSAAPSARGRATSRPRARRSSECPIASRPRRRAVRRRRRAGGRPRQHRPPRDELLPALMAKLAATGLGELEVREGAWKVRLRRPADGAPGPRAQGRAIRAERRRARACAAARPASPRSGPGRDERDGRDGHAGADSRRVGRHLAGGRHLPAARQETRTGTTGPRRRPPRRRRLLGVPQEVVAPVDGVVGASLVESGDAVEYGQELIVIELAMAPAADG